MKAWFPVDAPILHSSQHYEGKMMRETPKRTQGSFLCLEKLIHGCHGLVRSCYQFVHFGIVPELPAFMISRLPGPALSTCQSNKDAHCHTVVPSRQSIPEKQVLAKYICFTYINSHSASKLVKCGFCLLVGQLYMKCVPLPTISI